MSDAAQSAQPQDGDQQQDGYPENSDWDRIKPEQDVVPRGMAHYEYQGAQTRPHTEWGEPNQANQFADAYGPAMPQGPYWPTMQQVPHLMRSTMGNIGTFSIPMQRNAIGTMRGTLAYMKAYQAARQKNIDEEPVRELRELNLRLSKLHEETDATNREYRDILAGTDPGSSKQQQQLYAAALKHHDDYISNLIVEGNMTSAMHVLAERDKYSQDWQNMQKSVDGHLKEIADIKEKEAQAALADARRKKIEEQKDGTADTDPEQPALPGRIVPEDRIQPKPAAPAATAPTPESPSDAPAPAQGAKPADFDTAPATRFRSGQPVQPEPSPPSPGERPPAVPKRPAPPSQGAAEVPEQQQQQGAAEEPEQQPVRLAMAATGDTMSDAPPPEAQSRAQPASQQVAQAAPARPGAVAPLEPPKPGASMQEYADYLGKIYKESPEQIKADANLLNGSPPNARIHSGGGTQDERSRDHQKNEAAKAYLDYHNANLGDIAKSVTDYRKKHPDMSPDEEKRLQEWGIEQIAGVSQEFAGDIPNILTGKSQLRSATYQSNSSYMRMKRLLVDSLDPNFDENRFVWRRQAEQNFNTGVWGMRLAANAIALQHSAVFFNAVQNLEPSDYRFLNATKNWLSTQTGSPKVVALRGAVLAWAQEMAKSFRGNQSSLREVEEILNNVSTSSSPAQFVGYIRMMDGLLMGAINTGKAVYNNATYSNLTAEQMLRKYTGSDDAIRWLKTIQTDEANTADFRKGMSRYKPSDRLNDPVAQANESDSAKKLRWYLEHRHWDESRQGPDPEGQYLDAVRRQLIQEGFPVR
jgi:hypothetical protein